jgi:carbonic anhydrase/acetyltransferase-like protein (isoleucine patch superfamily)
MPLYELDGVAPTTAGEGRFWIAPDAQVMGQVTLGPDASVWFGAVIRGDNHPIVIGARTNIQDGSILHTDEGVPLVLGEGVTVGHRAVLHGCRIEDNVLIGIGATVLNGAVVGRDSLVGAHALITEGKSFPPRSMILGAPAQVRRPLSDDEVEMLRWSAAHYVENARRFAKGLRKLG